MAELKAVTPSNQSPVYDQPDKNKGVSQPWLSVLLFLGRRLFFWLFILLAIIYLTFVGLAMIDGTPLNEAIPGAMVSTVTYLSHLFEGDLGMSTAGSSGLNPLPVSEVVRETLPRSLGLLGISLLLASILGIFLGMRAALTGNQRSLGIILTTLIGISVPSFFAAFLLQWAVTSYARLFGNTLMPVGGFGWDAHLILPVIVLAARPLAQITRISFGSLRDVLQQDYVRTAHGKGLRRSQITYGHVLRNAAIPILTTIGLSFRFALSSLAVVELYFGWPGAGQLLLKSIAQGDELLTVALVLCLGIIIIVVNLLLEFSYRLIDPRLWESPSFLGSSQHRNMRSRLNSFGETLRDLFTDNAFTRWQQRRHSQVQSDPFARSLARRKTKDAAELDNPFIGRRSIWNTIRSNRAFMIGFLMILALLLVVLFGPQIAQHNPYTTRGLERIDGVLQPPPFAPDEQFAWGTDALGRDMQSLILTGAQQTLTLVVLAVAARLIVGIIMGAVAGWQNGRWPDRLISGLAEIIAAFPTLLLAMILVLAIGIRAGISSFVFAICFVGWGEIMQFVRGEVTAVRPQQYIESAVASGARTSRIFNRHIIPVLLGSLISIAALEISAVLMLLGELGFLSIFIGGGALIELPGVGVLLYSDVPEWGALLSNVRYQARPYPWTALYPMLAFFLTILAFNLFGEGMRVAVDKGNIVINRVFNRYTLILALVVFLGYRFLEFNSGSMPFFAEQAELFSGAAAVEHMNSLAAPEMNGRGLGTAGQALAAQYIAEQYAALDIQAAGELNTYFQNRNHMYSRLLAEPALVIHDGGPPLTYQEDFAAYPGRHISDGEAAGPIRLIGLGQRSGANVGGFRINYPELARADFTGEIILVFSDEAALEMSRIAKDGMLVVTDNPENLGKRFTLSGRSGRRLDLFTGESEGEETPSLWISRETADRLLQSAGMSVANIQTQLENLATEQVLQIELPIEASLNVKSELDDDLPVQHVLGYIPGKSGYEFCTDCLGEQLIIVMAQYDTPPPGPDGTVPPGAVDNASGVAVMLEAIRVLQMADFQPNRSYLFVAYSGEGLDGGEPVSDPDIKRFLQAKTGFASSFEPEAIIQLRGLGSVDGDRLQIFSSGSLRLAEIFEETGRRAGLRTERGEEAIDISLIYEDLNPTGQSSQEAPVVKLYWENWEVLARTPADVLDSVSVENIEKAGRALAMALMLMGQERNY